MTYKLRPWAKVVIGATGIMLILLMGVTDCPKCHHVICECQKQEVEIIPAASPNIETKTVDKPDVEGLIYMECDKQGIDETIALAIAKLETGHFTSPAYKHGNNIGGISIDEVPLTYATPEEGVKEFVTLLKKHYFSKGYNTVEKIGKKYCPANYDSWVSNVNELREELLND